MQIASLKGVHGELSDFSGRNVTVVDCTKE